MRIILFLIRKEFLQIFRDRFLSKAIFAIPVVQMLILVPAVTFEIKNVNLCVIDRDMTPASRELTGQLEGSTFFRVRHKTLSEREAQELMHQNRCDLIMQIPAGFGKDISRGIPVRIQVAVNAINASNAQLSFGYLNGVIQNYNFDKVQRITLDAGEFRLNRVHLLHRYWYNEMLNYKHYMMPGVLGILVLAIGFILAGLNLVKEKESGTIEQINVTPVKKYQFILGKMIPFLLIGLVDLAIGLTIGIITFGVPFAGSVPLLFLCSTAFLIGVLGLALFVSTFARSQQQFMFSGFFFIIVFVLMSGIFTPLESMPLWAQKIDLVNPMAYIMRINRMIMLKGSTFSDIRHDFFALMILAVCFTSLAILRYRKTV